MGRSYKVPSSNVLKAWYKKCGESDPEVTIAGGTSNVWLDKGKRYVFDVSDTEHKDGAITGAILLQVGNRPDGSGPYRKVGTFRIEGNGVITRAPKFLKMVAVNHSNLNHGIGSGGLLISSPSPFREII